MRSRFSRRFEALPIRQWPALVPALAALALLASCATKPNDAGKPAPREDLAEYRQITVEAHKVVQATLASLDGTMAQSPCPPRTVKAFSTAVQRLEVDSFRIRARAQAIRARGEAYFEQWHEHLHSLKDPAARQLAEQRREGLQERFDHVRVLTQQAREAFQPFLAGLHRIRNGLRTDAAITSTNSMKELVRTTRENGRKVETSLEAILGEVDAVAAMLKPEKASKKV